MIGRAWAKIDPSRVDVCLLSAMRDVTKDCDFIRRHSAERRAILAVAIVGRTGRGWFGDHAALARMIAFDWL